MLAHPQVIAVNMEAVQSELGMGGQVDSESYTCRSCLARGTVGVQGAIAQTSQLCLDFPGIYTRLSHRSDCIVGP